MQSDTDASYSLKSCDTEQQRHHEERLDEGGDLADDASALAVVVEGGVAQVERQPGILQRLAQDLVGINGLLGQAVVSAVVLRVAGLVGARGPLEEVLVGDAGHRQQQREGVEEPKALRLDHLHDGVAREARGDAALQAEDHTKDQRHQHGDARLLVPPEQLLLGLSLGVGRGLCGADGAEDAHSHDEVQMSQGTAVGELRQRLPVLEGLVQVPGQSCSRHVRDLVLQVAADLGGLLSDHLLHRCGPRPVRVLCWHQLAHQHVAVPLHPSLLGVLEDLKVLRGIRARLGEQDVVTTRVAADQGLQVVDPVVDDHVGLLGRVVLGNLRTGEERQVLSRGDLRKLGEPALL